jgi:hypothetical protein
LHSQIAVIGFTDESGIFIPKGEGPVSLLGPQASTYNSKNLLGYSTWGTKTVGEAFLV